MLEASRIAFPEAPPLTTNAVKAILQFTALKVHDDLGAEYDALTQGTGSVNPAGAIDLAALIERRPDQISAILRELAAALATGQLEPPPVTASAVVGELRLPPIVGSARGGVQGVGDPLGRERRAR